MLRPRLGSAPCDPASPAPLVGAAPSARAAPARARPDRAAPRARGEHRRPARDRPPAGSASGLRLRRRRRRHRGRSAPRARGVHARRAGPEHPARRLGGRRLDHDLRSPRLAAARLRSDRLHAPVPPRGRTRGGARRRAGGHSRRPVDGRHSHARGVRGRGAHGLEVVPALHVARPRRERRAHRARAHGRLPRPGAHGRRAGGRLAPARRAQRPRLPAPPDAAHARRHGACTRRGGPTCSPPSRWPSPR